MDRRVLKDAALAAWPIALGYVALGLPCGILCAKAGMDLIQVALMSLFLYSGSGQYMIANMWLAGTPVASLSASVTLVNMRQMLYASSLSRFFKGVSKPRMVWFAATVTDESFGVNIEKFQEGSWTPGRAQLVNTLSHCSWILSNVIGGLLGAWLVFDTSIAAFAMTSIFLCLLLMQHFNTSRTIALLVSIIGVVVCKLVGLANVAILVGAVAGVIAGLVWGKSHHEEVEDALD